MRYNPFYRSKFLLFLLPVFAACSKSKVPDSKLASLNIVNDCINLGAVKANFTGLTGLYSSIATSVAFAGNNAYSVNAEINVPLTIVPVSDTTKPVVSTSIHLVNGGVYSLFLSGQATAPDTLFVKDDLTRYRDSTCAVRFINLCVNSNPIIVTLSTNTANPEFSSLSYKQITSFRNYPAMAANTAYIFQVRDAKSDSLLGNYTLSPPRFNNCTLIWKGIVGGTGANLPSVQRVNNY